ncbi:hypothetical protein F4X88_14405 [Candidatus Poribacteria bacterium]|nr:hypothetical protein [Candidatus Poribacteria bacterium]
MFSDKWTLFFCLVVCVVCLFGIYRLQAAPQLPERPAPTPQGSEVTQPPRTTFSESIDSDFYQTIIRNNLFAPLGTDLYHF